MRRRQFLTRYGTAVTVAVTGLAGCTAPGPGAEDEESPTEAPGEGASPAEGTPTDETPSPTTETPTPTEGTPTPAAGAAAEPIRMVTEGSEYFFDPIGLLVEPGTTVTWEIESGSHSSTAYAEGTGPAQVTRIPQDAAPWNSGVLAEAGATFEHTFEVEGTYDYFCIPHKQLGMVGRIVVGQPGGPARGTQPPDGEVPTSQAIVEQGAISYDEFTG